MSKNNNKKAPNLANLIPLGQKAKQRNVALPQRPNTQDFNPSTFISTIEQSMKQENGQSETLIVNFLKSIKSTLIISSKNGKILPSQCLALFSICKKFPALFTKTIVVEYMCHILSYNGKETVNIGSSMQTFKTQSTQLHSVTAIKLKQLHIALCNMLLTCFKDSLKWPLQLVKSYFDDSFADRVWVDLPECNLFVRNIETAFPSPGLDPRTFFPLTSVSEQLSELKELGDIKINAGDTVDSDNNIIDTINKMLSGLTSEEMIKPRFEHSRVTVDSIIAGYIKENIERKYVPESQMKNLLRGFCSLAGIAEMRGAVVNKLDNWLSQTKQQTVTLNMVTIMASSCNQNIAQNSHDITFCVYLMLRFKYKTSKPQVQSTLLDCLKRISEMHPNNLRNMLLIYINNEIYNSPTIACGTTINTTNTAVPSSSHIIVNKTASVTFPAIYFRFPVESIKILGDIIHEQICIHYADIKPVRLLIRDLCRWIKLSHINTGGVYNNFTTTGTLPDCLELLELAQSLLADRNTTESLLSRINNPQFKETYIENMINVLCELQMLSIIRPSVKESFKEKSDHEKKDLDTLKHHYTTLRQIRYLACKWLKHVFRLVESQISPDNMSYYLRQVMFLNVVRNHDQSYVFEDSYAFNDLWINEPDKTTLIKYLTEIPLSEKLIQTVISLGFEKSLCYRPSEIVEMLSELIIRASACASNDIMAMNVTKGETIINNMFACCSYDLDLEDTDPRSRTVKTLAFKSSFWKVSQALVVMACHCTDTCGAYLWANYPTIKNLMKIIITNNFDNSNLDENCLETERSLCEVDVKKIIELESSLMEERIDDTICIDANTSKLIKVLMLNLPQGATRQPPPDVLESLKSINFFMKIGDRLSQCRNPDFLLEIVKSQDQSKVANRKWIIDLVKKTSELNLECLPLLCLTEYIYHDLYDKMSSNLGSLATASDTFKRLVQQIRQTLHSTKSDNKDHLSRVLGAFSNSFFIRLSDPSSFTRNIARECLFILLQPIGSPISSMSVPSQFVETLKSIVNLKMFQESSVICSIVLSLKETLKYETDIEVLCCYVELFSSMCSSTFNEWLVDLVETLAILILNRPIIIDRLKFRDHEQLKAKSDVLFVSDMLAEIFVTYIGYIHQAEAIPITQQDDVVMVSWRDKKCPMKINVVQCQISFLCWGIVKSSINKKLLDIWFMKSAKSFELPQFSSLSSPESPCGDVIPQWLVNSAINSGLIPVLHSVLSYHLKVTRSACHVINIALLFMSTDFISAYLKFMNGVLKEDRSLLELWIEGLDKKNTVLSIVEKLYAKVKRVSPLFLDFLKSHIDVTKFPVIEKTNLQPNIIVKPLIKVPIERRGMESMEVDGCSADNVWSGLIQSYDPDNNNKGLQIGHITHAVNMMLSRGGTTKDIKCAIGDLIKLLKDPKTHSETLRILNKSDFKLLPLLRLTFRSVDQDSFAFCEESFHYLFNSYPHIEKLTVWKMAYNLCLNQRCLFESSTKMEEESVAVVSHENYSRMVKNLVTDIMEGGSGDGDSIQRPRVTVLRKGPKIDQLTILGLGNCHVGDDSYDTIHRLLFSNHSLYQYSAYFMSDLLHQSSIDSLRSILHSLLKKKTLANLNASRVLDFIDASINHPKLQFPAVLIASKRHLWPQQNVQFEILEPELINLLALVINEADHLVQHNGLNSSHVNMVLTKRCQLVDISSAHPSMVHRRFSIINQYINSRSRNPTIEKLMLALYSRLPSLIFQSGGYDNLDMFFNNVDCFGTSVIHRVGKRLLSGLVSNIHEIQDLATQASKAMVCRHPKLCVQLLPYMSALSDKALDNMETCGAFKKNKGYLLYSTLLHLLEIMDPYCLASETNVRSDLLSVLSNCLRLLIRYRDLSSVFTLFVSRLVTFIERSIQFGNQGFVTDHIAEICALSRIYPQFKNVVGYGDNRDVAISLDRDVTVTPPKNRLDCLETFRTEINKCQYGAGLKQTFKSLLVNESVISSLCLDDLSRCLSSPMDEVRKIARQYLIHYLNTYPEQAARFLNQCVVPNLMMSSYYWARPFTDMALSTLRHISMLAPDVAPTCLTNCGRLFIAGNNGRGNYKESVSLLEEILDNISLESFMDLNVNMSVTPDNVEVVYTTQKRQYSSISERETNKAKRMRLK